MLTSSIRSTATRERPRRWIARLGEVAGRVCKPPRPSAQGPVNRQRSVITSRRWHTALVWRVADAFFVDSADPLCLERVRGVSLMHRAMASSKSLTGRSAPRVADERWAYLRSTGGRGFRLPRTAP